MKALFRSICFMLAVVAFVLLVVDGTTMIAGKNLGLTSTGEVIARLGDPAILQRWQTALSQKAHPLVWSAANTLIFSMPAMISALLGAAVFGFLGRKGEPDFDMRAREDV